AGRPGARPGFFGRRTPTMRLSRSALVRSRFRPLAGLGLLSLALVGCAGRGDVSGKVTYQSKAVPFGTVLFEGKDGSIQQGAIGPDGSYSVSGVATGEARVAVNSPNPKSSEVTPIDKKRKMERHPDVQGWFPIPKEYGTPSTSGLTYTIKRGANTIDIEMK